MNEKTRIHPVWSFIAAFVLINAVLVQKGNRNPGSRLATLAAMTENRTFRIDDYINRPPAWTDDWAKGPDGHYYSNKPPGPMLLGYPIFWMADRLITRGLYSPNDRFLRRRRYLPLYNWVLSLIFQILPFAWITWKILSWLSQKGYSNKAVCYSAIAILFGNTASVLMNTYFGHGIAAWCVMAMVLMALENRYLAAGFFGGLAFISDYSAPILVGSISLFCLCKDRSDRLQRCVELISGMVLPMGIGLFYFTECFGKPWLTALQFENPAFLESARQPQAVLGMFHILPSLSIIRGLLFGRSRGLLFTQPWVLLVLGAGLFQWHRQEKEFQWSSLRRWGIIAFVGLLWANGTFNGWHGGLTIGPRYMCIIFPIFGALATELYDHSGKIMQNLLGIALAVSVLLSALIFATTLYAPPEENLWNFLLWALWHIPAPWPVFRFLFFVSIFGSAAWYTHKTQNSVK